MPNTKTHDDQHSDAESPAVKGEQELGGDTTGLEADDDTLQAAQEVGMQLDEDPEHPKEVDIARDIDKAEEEIANS